MSVRIRKELHSRFPVFGGGGCDGGGKSAIAGARRSPGTNHGAVGRGRSRPSARHRIAGSAARATRVARQYSTRRRSCRTYTRVIAAHGHTLRRAARREQYRRSHHKQQTELASLAHSLPCTLSLNADTCGAIQPAGYKFATDTTLQEQPAESALGKL